MSGLDAGQRSSTLGPRGARKGLVRSTPPFVRLTTVLLRDFHPLLFFYLLGTITALVAVGLTGRLFHRWILDGMVPEITTLAAAFFTITSLNSLFFAFWMGMQANAHLSVRLPLDSYDLQHHQPPSPGSHV